MTRKAIKRKNFKVFRQIGYSYADAMYLARIVNQSLAFPTFDDIKVSIIDFDGKLMEDGYYTMYRIRYSYKGLTFEWVCNSPIINL